MAATTAPGSVKRPLLIRLLIVAGSVAAALLTFAQAFAQVADRAQPALAHSIWPVSGLLSARLADLSADPVTARPTAAGAAYAKDARRTEPLSVGALRSVALTEGGTPARAARLMALSERLSKRDLATQVWQIGRAAEAGDLDAMLVHYDRGLRGSVTAPGLLIPLLVKAMAVPEAVAPMVRLSDRDPFWFNDFAAAVTTTGDPAACENLTAVLMERPKLLRSFDRATLARLVSRLAGDGRLNLAQQVYDGLPGAGGRAQSGALAFHAAETVVPFDWRLPDDPAVSAGAVDSGLTVLVTRPADHLVAERLLHLTPGRWTIAGASRITSGVADAVGWRLSCAGSDRSLAALDIRRAATASFVVRARCEHQWLRLTVRKGGEEPLDMLAAPPRLTRAG